MTSNKLTLVLFEPRNGAFIGFMSIEGLISIEGDPELVLRKAAKLYEHSIVMMRSLIAEMDAFRASRKPVPARKIWQLGNVIFEMREELERLSLQLDGFYDHLVRDLGVKRKWLEKVIIFRRYVPEEELIPQSLNWGRCEKGTRKVAERLRDGLPIDKALQAAL